MGTLSTKQTDHLYWLGRYLERVKMTLELTSELYDQLIDSESEFDVDTLCERLAIPNIYSDVHDFATRYMFDKDDPNSVPANLERAFENVLNVACANHVPQDEMVKSLIVISDMEINECASTSWGFYDAMRERYANAGYEIPNVVFWNVDSRHDTFHADKDRKGVQLCSGQSAATFQQLMNSVGMTPTEMMLNVLGSARYAPITISA